MLKTPTIFRRVGVAIAATIALSGLTASRSAAQANYLVTQSNNNSYNSIATTGTSFSWASTDVDDNYTVAVPLTGTTFQLSGTAITSFSLGLNGYLLFNGATSTAYNTNLAAHPLIIAPFFEDLYVPTSGSLANNFKYKITGTLGSGTAVITAEWIGMETYQNTGPNLNFQVKLYEAGNKVEIDYGVMQGFNGVPGAGGAYNYSYAVGITGPAITATLPTSGQIFGQKYENSSVFGSDGFQVNDVGYNRLTKMPNCYSRLSFMPGTTYVAPAAPSGVPVNDEPANAIDLTPISCSPVDLCNTYFSSFGASATPGIPAACSGTPDDDVWFKFTSVNTSATVQVVSQGGYDAVVQMFDAARTTSLGCADATGEGLQENLTVSGLTIGSVYYVRVFHKQGGVQATATATIASGAVTSIAINTAGSGYMKGAYAGAGVNAYPVVYLVGGGGTNAVATTTTTGTNTTPAGIASVVVAAGGSGYTSAPTVVIAPPNAGISGDFGITIQQFTSAAANNNVANAIAIPATGAQYGPYSTATATAETGEPAPPAGACVGTATWCSTESTPQVNNSVWFTFVAPSNHVSIESIFTCGNSSNNQLALYSAASAAAILTGGATLIAANDDQSSTNNTAKIADACVTAGQTYYLQMDGYNGLTGAFRIAITSIPVTAGTYPSQCTYFPSLTLAGTPTGGVFSGTGVSGNTFSPSTAGAGTQTITYTYAGCTSTTPITVTSSTGGMPTTATSTQPLSGSTIYNNNCDLIATVTPNGANPVTGNITAKVTVDAGVGTYNGAKYVQRHYDITAASATNTSTSNLTIYFTQPEFTAYNTAVNNPLLALPTGPSDATGISHLKITQYHGTGTAPGNYTGWTGATPANVLIDPADANIVWNSTQSRWEVTFGITGFSGFYATGNIISPLPVRIVDFSARQNATGTAALIAWEVGVEQDIDKYIVQRSTEGISYSDIGSVKASGKSGYLFTDNNPVSGGNDYYRLRISELSGAVEYSDVRSLRFGLRGGDAITFLPNPMTQNATATITTSQADGNVMLVLHNAIGQEVQRYRGAVVNGRADIQVVRNGLPSGIYQYQLSGSNGLISGGLVEMR